ncbi:uncharacterized protein N0V89_000119 [Didymosphaeria variabile]|uniref:Uncharacterized protein n=1 Tax=Didymosphaeria variabile TaxID=1932322 RepID=A0A9W8XWT6_9PLEO|nr:uncharacterized protein N0V89_000119 [Didymosphaeria variabile]KAJ4359564.1 hypothetical protein N0V89_000119 [Didymosphaeria variabile]
MSTQIATFLLKQGGSLLWNHVKGGLFGKAKDQMAELREAQQKLLNNMTSMHFEGLIWNSIQKVEYWTKEMEKALKAENSVREKSGNKEPPMPFLTKDMTKLVDVIGSYDDGVGFQIDNIIAGVTGKNALVGKGGLIGAWNVSALDKLCNMDDLGYTIKDYLWEIEANLTLVANFLRDAHELRALVADDDSKRTEWATELSTSITKMQEQAWSIFPTALKTLKPSYTSQFLPESHWWRLEYSKDRGTYVSMRYPFYRGSLVERATTGPNPRSEWRFASALAKLNADGVVDESDKNVSRLVRLRSRKGEDFFGSKVQVGFCVEKEDASSFTPVVIKIVPVRDTPEAKIQLAFKRQSTAEMVRENAAWKYFGPGFSEEFVLRDEGVDQSDYVAPVEEGSKCVVM